MHTYSEHLFPSLKKNCHATHLRVTKTKIENAEVGNNQVPQVPPNTCVMIYMSLEGGERKLTFYLGYMSSMYVPVPYLYPKALEEGETLFFVFFFVLFCFLFFYVFVFQSGAMYHTVTYL